jgi:hypothetical protein
LCRSEVVRNARLHVVPTSARNEWNLVWDQGGRRWRGLAEDADRVEALRQLVAPHGGAVEVG